MTLKEAIRRADEIRPNALPEDMKASWVNELDGQIAEMMGKEPPVNTYPEDSTLLMPPPFDNIYYLYAAALIDHVQQDSELYYNDTVMFNASLDRAKAWYRRSNTPENRGNWRVM